MNAGAQISVVIIDDHPLFRQGVMDVLSLDDGIRIIGQASDGDEGFEIIRELQPDIAIVDINLPGLNGQQITQQVIHEKLPSRVLLLTAYHDQEQILHSAISGAAGYCSKDIEPVKLLQAVHEIRNGNYFLNEQVMSITDFSTWLENQLESVKQSYSAPGNPFHPLSNREMEVLNHVVAGKSNKEIASLLEISHQTVKNHVTSILRKFGVEDRTQAVVYALKRGWVNLNENNAQE